MLQRICSLANAESGGYFLNGNLLEGYNNLEGAMAEEGPSDAGNIMWDPRETGDNFPLL